MLVDDHDVVAVDVAVLRVTRNLIDPNDQSDLVRAVVMMCQPIRSKANQMTMLSWKISIQSTSILATTTAAKTLARVVLEVAADVAVAEEAAGVVDAIAMKQPLLRTVTIEHREVAVAVETMKATDKTDRTAQSAVEAEDVGEIVIVMTRSFQRVLIANRVAVGGTIMTVRKSRTVQDAVVAEDAVAMTLTVIAMKSPQRMMDLARADAQNAIGIVTRVTAKNRLPIHVKTEFQLGKMRLLA
jgi:hypothetical protein